MCLYHPHLVCGLFVTVPHLVCISFSVPSMHPSAFLLLFMLVSVIFYAYSCCTCGAGLWVGPVHSLILIILSNILTIWDLTCKPIFCPVCKVGMFI